MNTAFLDPDSILLDAVRLIEESHRRIALVLDGNKALIGTLTDGDIRRCLLAGGSLQTSVLKAMNTSPLVVKEGSTKSQLIEIMKIGNVMAIPVVDEKGHFKNLIHLTDLEQSEKFSEASGEFEFAVIMAGGEGTRLRPITANIPKPMVEIGGRPLLEHQVLRMIRAGIRRIYISINYLGHVIEDHFGDGSNFGVDIRYLRENEKLGTAGALALLPERPRGPIIIMNGDIFTTINFESLCAFHKKHGALITLAAIDHKVNIPYGVVNTDGFYVKDIVEKPSQRFLCNAGIYAISPLALDSLQSVEFLNMTDIINASLNCAVPVSVFPIHEYWSDIGTPDDLERTRASFLNGKK